MSKYQFSLTKLRDLSGKTHPALEIIDEETDVVLGTFTYDDAARILLEQSDSKSGQSARPENQKQRQRSK